MWYIIFIYGDGEVLIKCLVLGFEDVNDGCVLFVGVFFVVWEEELYELVVVEGEGVEVCGVGDVGLGVGVEVVGLCCCGYCVWGLGW